MRRGTPSGVDSSADSSLSPCARNSFKTPSRRCWRCRRSRLAPSTCSKCTSSKTHARISRRPLGRRPSIAPGPGRSAQSACRCRIGGRAWAGTGGGIEHYPPQGDRAIVLQRRFQVIGGHEKPMNRRRAVFSKGAKPASLDNNLIVSVPKKPYSVYF